MNFQHRYRVLSYIMYVNIRLVIDKTEIIYVGIKTLYIKKIQYMNVYIIKSSLT